MKVKGGSFPRQQEKLNSFQLSCVVLLARPFHIYVYELETSHAQITVVGRLDGDKRPSPRRAGSTGNEWRGTFLNERSKQNDFL